MHASYLIMLIESRVLACMYCLKNRSMHAAIEYICFELNTYAYVLF